MPEGGTGSPELLAPEEGAVTKGDGRDMAADLAQMEAEEKAELTREAEREARELLYLTAPGNEPKRADQVLRAASLRWERVARNAEGYLAVAAAIIARDMAGLADRFAHVQRRLSGLSQ